MRSYQIGDYISYGVRGLCRVNDIRKLSEMKINDDRLYYELIPANKQDSKIFIPIQKINDSVRAAMTKDEAWMVIHKIPFIEPLEIEDEKKREIEYKKAICSGDYIQWIKLIKTLYKKKQKRQEEGKSLTGVDELYFLQAESLLNTELSLGTEIASEKIPAVIEAGYCEENPPQGQSAEGREENPPQGQSAEGREENPPQGQSAEGRDATIS